MEEPEKPSLRKWKQLSIRITVIHRFSRSYSAKSFITPGLTAASPQVISKVKKNNPSEVSETRSLSTEALNSGALFSPNTILQDELKQKFTSEKKKSEGYYSKLGDVFKHHRVLSPIQILVTGLTSQIKEADLLGRRIIVTVIDLASRQEGTTATDNHVVWTALKGLFFLLWFTSKKIGVNAQAGIEDGKRECPNERENLPYLVQAAVWAFVALIVMIVIARRINRRPLVRVPVAAPPAVRPPAAAPPALPAAAAAPPANPPPAAGPSALPAAAAAPPAIPPPAAAPPAVPPPAAAPPALPAAAAAPPAIPPPAAGPPALPAAAVAPPAVQAAMGFINVMDGLAEDPTPARHSNPNLRIAPPL